MKTYNINAAKWQKLHAVTEHADPKIGARLLAQHLRKMREKGFSRLTCHFSKADAKKQEIMDILGFTPTQEKMEFFRPEPQPLIAVPKRLTFRSLDDVGEQAFISVIRRVLIGSLDRGNQIEVTTKGIEQTARKLHLKPKNANEFQPDWWNVACTDNGEFVGFCQPVLDPSDQRGSLKQGIIRYIGVVPEYRGRGYINDLLSKATHTLQRIGVWEIWALVDTLNHPMIAAFKQAGYESGNVGVYYDSVLEQIRAFEN